MNFKKFFSIDGHKFDAVVALRGCDQSAPVIVLSHNPASAKDITFNSENLRVDLILSGWFSNWKFSSRFFLKKKKKANL